MTFRLPRVLDKHYTCHTGHPEHPTVLDDSTWTCKTCRQSVRITVIDRADQQFTVERRPARELTTDDQVVYYNGIRLSVGAVKESAPARGKDASWYLAVEGCRGEPIDPGQYIARQID